MGLQQIMNACRHEGKENAKVLTTVTKPTTDASQINEEKKKKENIFLVLMVFQTLYCIPCINHHTYYVVRL